MKYLLDVNMLLAGIRTRHTDHDRAKAWLDQKEIALCPISELGFLRISCNRRAFNFDMKDARAGLKKFAEETNATRIPDDLDALDS